jgi:hypothetical protein
MALRAFYTLAMTDMGIIWRKPLPMLLYSNLYVPKTNKDQRSSVMLA